TGERVYQRLGAIEAGEGRRVVVERLVGEPRGEAPRERPRREAPSGDDRPRRPARAVRDAGSNHRAPDDSRPPRREFRSDGRPRAGPPGGNGGFKGGPRGGPSGGKGGSKGGPHGKRP